MKCMNIYGRMYRDEADGGEGSAAGGGGTGGGGSGEDAGESSVLDQLKTQLEASQADNQRLQAKISEANKHAKAAEKKAAEEARSKAEAEGNYEQLFKSSEQERVSLEERLTGIIQQTEREKITATSLKLASSLAEGENVELLAVFLQRRLKYADEGIKVTDENGNLTDSSLDDLSKEFANSARYASLIKGRQSSGGGASGGSSGNGVAKEISRAEFNALDPASQMKFLKSDGGKVID